MGVSQKHRTRTMTLRSRRFIPRRARMPVERVSFNCPTIWVHSSHCMWQAEDPTGIHIDANDVE
jgi:hypothetical protein